MSATEIRDALVAQLRAVPAGTKPHLGEIRRAIAAELGSCTTNDLAAAVQALRFQGKLQWERLELTPSMLTEHSGGGSSFPPEQEDGGAGDQPSSECEKHGTPFISPGVCPFCDEEVRKEEAADGGKPPPPPVFPPADEEDGAGEGPFDIRDDITGAELAALLEAKGRCHGMTTTQVSFAVWAYNSGISMMRKTARPGQRTLEKARHWLKSLPPIGGPDDDDDYPGQVNDVAPPADVQPAIDRGSCLDRQDNRRAVRGAATCAARRAVPAPSHEPEIARMVREEASAAVGMRRRASSSGSVRLPVELRRYGVEDMSLSEALGTMLSDSPQAIMRAVSRKHPEMWRRCIQLGRATGQSPMQALYAALEAGLNSLELPEERIANVA